MPMTRTWTDEELMALPDDGLRRELVGGEIVEMNAAGVPHGWVIVRLTALLATHVMEHDLGYVFDGQTGWRLSPDTVRIPDCTFISHARLPQGPTKGFLRDTPDLTVEVVSPDDSERYVLEKVGQSLDAGVKLAWVIDPETRSAAAYRSLTRVRHLGEDDVLDGEDVVPGFRCRLGELFVGLPRD
jgi:Uma2 family endonuclease